MRKNVLFAVFAASVCLSVSAFNPANAGSALNQKQTKIQSRATSLKLSDRQSAKQLKATRADNPLSALTEADIITTLPDGVSTEMWAKDGDYYTVSLFGIGQGIADGIPVSIAQDGADFYIKDPFSGVMTDSYLKGTVSGDKLTFKLPQAIYADEDWETGERFLYAAQICHFEYDDPNAPEEEQEGLYYPEEGETELVFTKDGDRWVMETLPEVNGWPVILSIVDASDGEWCAYSDWNTAIYPFADNLVEAPANLQQEDWMMVSPNENGDYICASPLKVGIDGNDMYVLGLTSDFPEAWVKGVIDNDKVTFESAQYLGPNEMINAFGYFFGATVETVYDEEWDYEYQEVTLRNNITFNYDAKSKRLVCGDSDAIVINAGKAEDSMINCYVAPRIYAQGEVTNWQPMDPIPTYYYPMDDYAGSLYFEFPSLNVDGQILNTDNLYYSVYLDGEPLTFYNDEYIGLESETEMIPYNFNNWDNLGCYGTGNITHYFMFTISGYDRMDIQTFYIDGDKKFESKLVNVVDTSSVKGIDAEKEVLSTEYFDIAGRRISEPSNGLYLKREVYTDGTSRTLKVVKVRN